MTHRIFGAIAASLFVLFAIAGVVALFRTLPSYSCAGMVPSVQGASNVVKLAGPGWTAGIKPTDCVQLATNGHSGYNLGSASESYGGSGWTYARVGIGAWVAWTLAMTMLAIAVATIPKRGPLGQAPNELVTTAPTARGHPGHQNLGGF